MTSKTHKIGATSIAAPPKPRPPAPPTPEPSKTASADQDFGEMLASTPLVAADTKEKPSANKAESDAIKAANQAAEDAKKKGVAVRDFSTDKPNREIASYKTVRDGTVYRGNKGKLISRRDSGVNRFAILIAREDGASEADLRHVNPRGYEYSGGGAGYVSQNTPMDILVKDGRYHAAEIDSTGAASLNEATRKVYFEAFGGQEYLDRTVQFIRANTKYPEYATFKLSGGTSSASGTTA